MSHIIAPHMSEKAYKSAQEGTYVFDIPAGLEKAEIIAAIEANYGVKVVDARVSIRKGKTIRSSRGKRAQPAIVSRKDAKKAYVRLAEGQKLNLFGDDEKKEEKK